MKSKLLFLMLMPAIIIAACENNPKEEPGSRDGDESVVSLTIFDATRVTRAADTDTEEPTGPESAIDVSKGISVVVYNVKDELVFPESGPVNLTLTETGPGTGVYTSPPFTITSGQKYFYVFANEEGTLVGTPPVRRPDMIARSVPTTLNASDQLSLTIPNFLIGTLWSEKKTVPEGGTTAAPVTVPLEIGRLASKVILKGVEQGTPSTMAGVFSNPEYRIGTIPKIIFLAGNNDETLPVPPARGHGVVTSAVHTTGTVAVGGDANYYQYSHTWKEVDKEFYVVENTTAPDADELQYYGNTSYIQICTVYTPDGTEVYKVDDLSVAGSFTGPTFYTARLISNGERLIFENDPRTAAGFNPHADIDQNTVEVYTDGLNYHKFPIHDKEAGLLSVQKNAVLRNHYYEYTVTSIGDIGSSGPDVDPKEPIESQTTLIIEVRVSKWSKVSNNNIPI